MKGTDGCEHMRHGGKKRVACTLSGLFKTSSLLLIFYLIAVSNLSCPQQISYVIIKSKIAIDNISVTHHG